MTDGSPGSCANSKTGSSAARHQRHAQDEGSDELRLGADQATIGNRSDSAPADVYQEYRTPYVRARNVVRGILVEPPDDRSSN
jgi:hypothetical protein